MPVYHIKQVSEHATLGIWELTESNGELLEFAQLTKSESVLFAKFSAEGRKAQWLAIRALLNTLRGEKTIINYTSIGQPVLKDSDLKISISHSGKFACIITDHSDCGIDIEKGNSKIERIQHKFLHPEEKEFIEESKYIDYLKIIWSAKETLYKLHGKGDLIFNKELIISPFIPGNQIKLKGRIEFKNTYKEVALTHEKTEGYTLVYSA